MRKPRKSSRQASQLCTREVASTTAILATTCLPCSVSTKRGRLFDEAQARKLDDYVSPQCCSMLWPFLSADSHGMAEQLHGLRASPIENFGLSLASDTEAYGGHLGKARELTKRAVDSAMRADSKENGGDLAGDCGAARSRFRQSGGSAAVSGSGFEAGSASQGVEVEAGACVCHGGRYGASRIAGARPGQAFSAGYADAVALAAGDSGAIGAEQKESGCRHDRLQRCYSAHRVGAN